MSRVFQCLTLGFFVWSIIASQTTYVNVNEVDSVTNYYRHFRCFDACFRLNPDMDTDSIKERYDCSKQCYRTIFLPNIIQLD